MTLNSIGRWFSLKYQQQARERGHYTTAKALRKQGVPLEVALALLFGQRNTGALELQRIASAARCVL